MGPSDRRIMLRRAAVLAGAALATAAVWVLFLRPDDDGGRDRVPQRGVSEEIRERVEALSMEERVDQILLLGFDGTTADGPVAAEIEARQLGGVLVGPTNWPDTAQGTALVTALRDAGRADGRIPPLMVTAQEGGEFRSLADLPPEARALDIGDAGSVAQAERWARETAEALRVAGFDLNLFPVADVATLDSPLGARAFSDDTAVVAAMTAASVRGCRVAAIACAPLHFPGLGASSQDTDQGPATVSLDAASLDSRDVEPFLAAFAERAEAVVLSLAFYAAYDAVTPAALSRPIATGMLRDRLGFDGLAITDDLSSGAVKATYRVPQAAVAALAAGSDLVQISLPADQEGVRDAILAAVRDGEIAEERLAEAAGRVLELKQKLGLLQSG